MRVCCPLDETLERGSRSSCKRIYEGPTKRRIFFNAIVTCPELLGRPGVSTSVTLRPSGRKCSYPMVSSVDEASPPLRQSTVPAPRVALRRFNPVRQQGSQQVTSKNIPTFSPSLCHPRALRDIRLESQLEETERTYAIDMLGKEVPPEAMREGKGPKSARGPARG